MDALALLCNLYGDGPSTLKRLRAHGVLRIEDLGERQTPDLATVLALTPAGARRFLKEASALEARVLDSQEVGQDSPMPPVVGRAARPAVRGKDAMLAAAARRWSELDRESPLFPASQPVAKNETSVEAARGIPLAEAGLDRATHDALHAVGIRTLEELASMDSDVLARSAGLGLSQILFVQGLARRNARDHGERAKPIEAPIPAEKLAVCVLNPGPRFDPRFSPAERPTAEWLSEATAESAGLPDSAPDEGAGPFA